MTPSMKPRRARPQRWTALLIFVSVLAAACGSSGGDSGASNDEGSGGDSETSGDGISISPADDENGSADSEEPLSTNGNPAPAIEFTYFDGSEGSLDDFEGTPVVVNFWASWCAPCVAEMPALEEVFQEAADEVAFLGFNVTDQRDDAEDLIDQTGVTYTMAEDPDGEIHRAFRGFAMPTTILIAADGTVARSHAGVVSGDQLRRFLAEDLGL